MHFPTFSHKNLQNSHVDSGEILKFYNENDCIHESKILEFWIFHRNKGLA